MPLLWLINNVYDWPVRINISQLLNICDRSYPLSATGLSNEVDAAVPSFSNQEKNDENRKYIIESRCYTSELPILAVNRPIFRTWNSFLPSSLY